jgi:hypothetical protein
MNVRQAASQGVDIVTYVCDGVELNKHDSIRKRHQTNEHQIHSHRDNTQTSVVSYQWLVLSETVLLDQSGSNNLKPRND